FAAALHAARQELPEAPELLDRVTTDPRTTGIARATAFAEMAPYLTPTLAAELRAALADTDPLVRLGALRGLEGLRPARRWAVGGGRRVAERSGSRRSYRGHGISGADADGSAVASGPSALRAGGAGLYRGAALKCQSTGGARHARLVLRTTPSERRG